MIEQNPPLCEFPSCTRGSLLRVEVWGIDDSMPDTVRYTCLQHWDAVRDALVRYTQVTHMAWYEIRHELAADVDRLA